LSIYKAYVHSQGIPEISSEVSSSSSSAESTCSQVATRFSRAPAPEVFVLLALHNFEHSTGPAATPITCQHSASAEDGEAHSTHVRWLLDTSGTRELHAETLEAFWEAFGGQEHVQGLSVCVVLETLYPHASSCTAVSSTSSRICIAKLPICSQHAGTW
jgi:hypothetical protein